ncbi:hypothetical protein B0H16DRAFT_1473388 [Mycena metata]|uniref:Uncharacterized protein n=1 Tax=Mycena metata TaxID=1033252 RepID=A0AAD7HK30_9AGAR|nr:hypothetical protein B0H16DRAFT_1473388 [Mycena metata]
MASPPVLLPLTAQGPIWSLPASRTTRKSFPSPDRKESGLRTPPVLPTLTPVASKVTASANTVEQERRNREHERFEPFFTALFREELLDADGIVGRNYFPSLAYVSEFWLPASPYSRSTIHKYTLKVRLISSFSCIPAENKRVVDSIENANTAECGLNSSLSFPDVTNLASKLRNGTYEPQASDVGEDKSKIEVLLLRTGNWEQRLGLCCALLVNAHLTCAPMAETRWMTPKPRLPPTKEKSRAPPTK